MSVSRESRSKSTVGRAPWLSRFRVARALYLSPLSILFILLVSIFLTEVTTFSILAQLPLDIGELRELLDALALPVVVFVPLYFLVFRPLTSQLTWQIRAKEELRRGRDGLEDLVRERTAELGAANDELRQEMARRERSELAREQLMAEVERRASEIDAVIASAAEGLVIHGPDGEVRRMNRAAKRILGYDPEEEIAPGDPAMARVVAEFGEGRTLGPGDIPLSKALRGETVHGSIMLLRPPEGKPVWVSASAAPIFAPDGRRLGAVSTFTDITGYAELSHQREQLLYDVSHELRGPLGVLENDLVILSNEFGALSAKELDQLMASALRVARRLRRLMEDLLNVGVIHAGRLVIDAQPTELGQILSEAFEAVGPMIDDRRQRVEREVPPGTIYVLADKRYAPRALANLLSNASRYSPDRAVIRLQIAREPGQVRVTVVDRGMGIPAEKLERLFNRFYRIRHETGEPGIGLGLAIAKGIVTAHGGSIGIDSDLGAGTRAWCTLPAAEEPGDANPGS